MSHPKLHSIDILLKKGEDFSLTLAQYRQKTGADFPKEKYYAENRSAIAKKAKEYGFKVVVIPQYVEFKKI